MLTQYSWQISLLTKTEPQISERKEMNRIYSISNHLWHIKSVRQTQKEFPQTNNSGPT